MVVGREKDVEEIREFISTIVPDPDTHTRQPVRNLSHDRTGAAE